jgi:FAD synthase
LRVAATGVATAHFAVRVNIVRVGAFACDAVSPTTPSARRSVGRRVDVVVGRARGARLWVRLTDHDSSIIVWIGRMGADPSGRGLELGDAGRQSAAFGRPPMSRVAVAGASVDARWRANERVGTSRTRRSRRCAIAEARVEGFPTRGVSIFFSSRGVGREARARGEGACGERSGERSETMTDECVCVRAFASTTESGDGTERPLAVCLGKFDSMHRGHFALAERAATLGDVVMVSFSGMAETLGWESRLPITAPSDRARVLALWSQNVEGKNVSLREHALAFSDVRELSPEAFVKMLAEMDVKAVVTGENYRFGYKAAGDVEALKTFGAQNGMTVNVVDLVPAQTRSAMGLGNQVSSSRVRQALNDGNIDDVNWMLGREHRLVFNVSGERTANALRAALASGVDEINISLEAAENQPPSDGHYTARVYVDQSPEGTTVSPTTVPVQISYGRLVIDRNHVPEVVFAERVVAVDFVARSSPRYAMGVSGRW